MKFKTGDRVRLLEAESPSIHDYWMIDAVGTVREVDLTDATLPYFVLLDEECVPESVLEGRLFGHPYHVWMPESGLVEFEKFEEVESRRETVEDLLRELWKLEEQLVEVKKRIRDLL